MAMATKILFLYLLAILTPSQGGGGSSISYEYGYAVSTVLEGDKVEASSPLNPFAALPLPGGEEVLLLDSSNSGFYTLSLPISQESKINRFAGSGVEGYSDGDAASAKFDHPRSFAVDSRGNVYVADQKNHAVRKISSSGVTTIAGGYSTKAGHVDGPGQNATFSDDFDLTYNPKKCALLISDRGTRRIRQMNLKADDCLHKTPQLGLTWTLIIGTVCLLVGLASGFAVRPFIISRNFPGAYLLSMTWNHCRTQVEKQVQIFSFGIRNAIASTAPYIFVIRLLESTLSYLYLLFRFCFLDNRPLQTESMSFDLDSPNTVSIEKPQETVDYLKDLMSLANASASDGEKSNLSVPEKCDALNDCEYKIDEMIQASIRGFDNSFGKGVIQRRTQVVRQ